MKTTTSTYKSILSTGKARKFLFKIDLTLANNTVLHLTEADIWEDSFTIDTASSGTSSLDIGSAVIGKCKFTLNNIDGDFDNYDFFNASAVVWLGLVGDVTNSTQTYYRMGYYTVDEPQKANGLISLELLDYMWKLDVPVSESGITFTSSSTARSLINSMCSHCGLTLATQSFHGYDFPITQAPDGVDEMNCRELLQYIAMIGCNFCYMDDQGNLRLKWYDVSATASTTDVFDYNMSTTFGTDSITVTGVKIIIDNTAYMRGSTGYVLEIENPLINASNVSSALNLIWSNGYLKNFTLHTFNITTAADLAVEIGDKVKIRDYQGNYIYSYVTLNSFKTAAHLIQCNAQSANRTLVKRYSKDVKTAVEEARKNSKELISTYDLSVQSLNRLVEQSMGGYTDYEDAQNGGRIYYISNMPITKSGGSCSFETGSVVWRMAGDVFSVSNDGGHTWQNGYNPSTGELVVNVLSAIGINAEWIRTGTLYVGGSQGGTEYPTIEVYDSNDQLICEINRNGITMHQGIISSPDYAEVSGATYATTGMKLDVLNKILRSPYFAIDTNGAYFKGTILITGDFEIRSSRFIPAEYGIADDFDLCLQAPEGYSGSCSYEIELIEYGGITIVATGTITNDTPVYLYDLDPETSNPTAYYEITLSDSSVKAYIHEATLAYVGQEGLKGKLEGVVEGSLYSDYGHINGIAYGTDWDGKHLMTGRFAYPASGDNRCRVLDFANASFSIADSNVTNVKSQVSLGDNGVVYLSGVGDNDDTIARIYERDNLGCDVFIKKGSNGGVITRQYDNPQQPGHFLENSVLWDSDIQTSQQDSPPASLADGHLFLVYE